MESDAQEARQALQAIAQAETAARWHSPNNGTVPLVFGGMVLTCMAAFDLRPCLGNRPELHRAGGGGGLDRLLPAPAAGEAAEDGKTADAHPLGHLPRGGADGRHGAQHPLLAHRLPAAR